MYLKTLFVLVLILASGLLNAQTRPYNFDASSGHTRFGLRCEIQPLVPRYNPFERKWKPARVSDQLRYNAFENSWSYASPEARLKYNPFDKSWYYDR